MKKLWNKWTDIALVKRILVGLILGAILGIAVPGATGIAILGDVFVSALKAIAPLLVFFLVISSLCNAGKSHGGVIKTVIILYCCHYRCSSTAGYCRGSQQSPSESGCQPGIFPCERKLCRHPYVGNSSWPCIPCCQ